MSNFPTNPGCPPPQLLEDSNTLCTVEQSGKVTGFDLVEGVVLEELETLQVNPTCIYVREGLLLLGNDSKSFGVYNKEG